MERDKVLPIAYKPYHLRSAQLQQAADWEVLQRDYVPKEQVKALVEAAQNLISCSDCGRGACAINLKMALAGLGVEMKP